MTNQAYIIRQQRFAYNDEFYLRDEAYVTQIHAVYADRESAHQACKQLNLEVLPREILGNYFAPEYQQADIELLQQLNQFCLERCGQPLFDERGRHEDQDRPLALQALLGHFDELTLAVAVHEGGGLERLHLRIDQGHCSFLSV